MHTSSLSIFFTILHSLAFVQTYRLKYTSNLGHVLNTGGTTLIRLLYYQVLDCIHADLRIIMNNNRKSLTADERTFIVVLESLMDHTLHERDTGEQLQKTKSDNPKLANDDHETNVDAQASTLKSEKLERQVRAAVRCEKRKHEQRVQTIEREARETAAFHNRELNGFLLRRARLQRTSTNVQVIASSVASSTSVDADNWRGAATGSIEQRESTNVEESNNGRERSSLAAINDATAAAENEDVINEQEEDLRKLKFRLHRRFHSVMDPRFMTSEEIRIYEFIQQIIRSKSDPLLGGGIIDPNAKDTIDAAVRGRRALSRIYIASPSVQLSNRMGVNVQHLPVLLDLFNQTPGSRKDTPDTLKSRQILRLLDLRPRVLPPICTIRSMPSLRRHVTFHDTMQRNTNLDASIDIKEELNRVKYCRYIRMPPQQDIYMT